MSRAPAILSDGAAPIREPAGPIDACKLALQVREGRLDREVGLAVPGRVGLEHKQARFRAVGPSDPGIPGSVEVSVLAGTRPRRVAARTFDRAPQRSAPREERLEVRTAIPVVVESSARSYDPDDLAKIVGIV